jgi:hypothetical protein
MRSPSSPFPDNKPRAANREPCEAAGLSAADLEALAAQIDRPLLLRQRQAFGG